MTSKYLYVESWLTLPSCQLGASYDHMCNVPVGIQDSKVAAPAGNTLYVDVRLIHATLSYVKEPSLPSAMLLRERWYLSWFTPWLVGYVAFTSEQAVRFRRGFRLLPCHR